MNRITAHGEPYVANRLGLNTRLSDIDWQGPGAVHIPTRIEHAYIRELNWPDLRGLAKVLGVKIPRGGDTTTKRHVVTLLLNRASRC